MRRKTGNDRSDPPALREAQSGGEDAGGEDAEGRPARILAAAAELMGERGFDGTSVQAIADRAEVNKALVFYYFGNKTKLFAKIFEHFLGGLHRALEASLVGAGAPEPPRSALDKLHAVVDAYSDYIEEHPSYPRLVQRELSNAQGRHDLLASYNARNYELVRSSLGELTHDEAGPEAAHQLFASVVGMILYYHLAAPVMLPGVADPLSPEARQARRAHVHWAVDALVSAVAKAR